MKILSLAQVDMSATEAGVVHVIDLADAMSKIGEEVDAVVISEGRPVVKKEWLKVYTMPKWTGFWLVKGLLYNLMALWIILKASRDYDVVYVRYSPNLALALWLTRGRVSLWLEINGISRDEEEHIKRRAWHFGRIYVGRFMEWIAYRAAHKCICVTQKIADYLCEYYRVDRARVRVVPNGVDTETYKPMDKTYCRKKLGLGRDLIYIGFIGNFIAWQGIDTILNVLPSIMEKWPRLRALLVGDGQYFEEYTTMANNLGIADKVIFPGYVHKDAAPMWINSLDIGLVLKRPITSGYSPLKLYSYMACGIPVLATDTAGFEPVEEHKAGILIPYGDTEGLVKAIETLVGNEKLRLLYGCNGRRCAEESFSWKTSAKKIVD